MAHRSSQGSADRESQLLDLISAIYDAALAPESLPGVLAQLTAYCGALWTLMSVLPPSGGNVLSLQNTGADSDHLALFERKFATPETNPTMLLMLVARPGDILLREQFYSDAAWERFEIYQQICRPIGIGACLGAVLLRSRQQFVPLGMFRSKRLGAFGSETLANLARVLPHLKRMMQILFRLDNLETKAALGDVRWGGLPYGMLLLDETGRILWANSIADSILACADGLLGRGGMLQARGAEADAALLKLISEAAATAIGRGTGSGGVITLPRALRRPLVALISPFRMERRTHIALARPPAVVVFISDPERHPQVPADVLARLYGFTPREAALAALLLQGLDLGEAADQLRVSVNTVRAHLRQIFEKTGTHRQGQLVSLLLRSAAALRTGTE